MVDSSLGGGISRQTQHVTEKPASCCYDGLADGSTLAAVAKSHVRYPVGPADTDDLAKMAAVVGINANQVGPC